MVQAVSKGRRWLGENWCSLMHSDSSWPVHGSYRCQACNRSYPVPWANSPRAFRAAEPSQGTANPAGVAGIARPARVGLVSKSFVW